jgi:hypothetical protein
MAGIDGVIPLDSPARLPALAERLRKRLAAPPPETEIKLLWRWFRESPERPLILHCIRNAFGVDDWTLRVDLFAASRRTLQNRMTLLRLPSPGVIARCGRMYHAQEIERRGVRQARDIAALLGIPTAAALHRARRRVRHSLLDKGPQALVFASLLK